MLLTYSLYCLKLLIERRLRKFTLNLIMSHEFCKAPFLLKLMSICISSVEKAGFLIKQVVDKGELNLINKGNENEFDPQTEADRLSQLCIIGKLKECFPSMIVIGEEGELNDNLPKHVLTDIHPNEAVLKINCPTEFYHLNEHNIIVWVDPLDGTNGFSKGIYEQVIISLGIASIEGSPIAGILHQPFCCNFPINSEEEAVDYSKSFKRTIWGIIDVGLYGLESRLRFRKANSVALISKSHFTTKDLKLAQALDVDEVISTSGAAYKGLCVLEEEADILLYHSGGTKKWDICAIDVFFRILGGQLTDINGQNYKYGPKTEFDNTFGVIASLKNHDNYIKKIKTYCLTNN
ncbi:hypothetical protein HZS_5862 [Henneguya salminicola]|uniref:3'(2'),5'-bisphosphate nucleotidase 1 (Trinotate prediction) n=1 Tax=Henneguya salminicola TaxID=69463 RepID=A0A6G3MGE3_HENSL|nr:hypothetical protein HZS_5862 [Henneguya salminicola]